MIGRQLSGEKKIEIKKRMGTVLAGREDVTFAYLYGSFITARWFRDLDIAVFVDEKKVSKAEALDHEIALSLELEKGLRLPVDAKVLNYAPLSFKYEVTKGEVVFSRDEKARLAFLEETWHRYLDYAPVEREFISEML